MAAGHSDRGHSVKAVVARTGRKFTPAGGLLALAFVLSGCTASAETPPLDIEHLRETTTAFQREILEDGVVERSEYERAVLAQRDCTIEAGALPGEIIDVGNNELGFEVQAEAATESALDVINLAVDACIREYIQEVGTVWAYQQLLLPEDREAQRPLVIDCLQAAGVELADEDDFDEIIAKVSEEMGPTSEKQDAIGRCLDEYPGFFAVAPTTDEHDH